LFVCTCPALLCPALLLRSAQIPPYGETSSAPISHLSSVSIGSSLPRSTLCLRLHLCPRPLFHPFVPPALHRAPSFCTALRQQSDLTSTYQPLLLVTTFVIVVFFWAGALSLSLHPLHRSSFCTDFALRQQSDSSISTYQPIPSVTLIFWITILASRFMTSTHHKGLP
jgi:hypothetical protein